MKFPVNTVLWTQTTEVGLQRQWKLALTKWEGPKNMSALLLEVDPHTSHSPAPWTKAELLLGTGAHHRLGAASANTPTVHQGLCAGARFSSPVKEIINSPLRIYIFPPSTFQRPLRCKPDKIFFCTRFPTDYQMASAFLVLSLTTQLSLDALTCLQSRHALSHLGAVAQISKQKELSISSTCSHSS